MKKERILVVGATGFIGKNLAPRLALDRRISVLARPTSDTGLFRQNPNIRIRHGDLDTGHGLSAALENIDLVIHCAGRTMARTYAEFHRTNTLGTSRLVHEMKQSGVRKLLYLSSHAACGPARGSTPAAAAGAEGPVSFYGHTKRLAESSIARSGLRYTIVRPVAVYGPHDREILTYVKLLNRGICPVVGSGAKYVNVIYVKDLVDMIVRIVEMDIFNGQTYFANDGKCYSFEALLDTIAHTLGKSNVKVRVPRWLAMFIGSLNDAVVPSRYRLVTRDKVRELACPYWVCDNTRTVKDIGFRPRYTFERGIAETIEWYRESALLS